MASPSTNCSSGSSGGDLHVVIDQRKRKRMESNRESARRSRMRRQKHLDDLSAQVTQLRNENNHILTGINVATEHFLNIDAENSILRAQMMELSHRLDSLNEMINYICCTVGTNQVIDQERLDTTSFGPDHGFINTDPFSPAYVSHPIMAAPAEAMLQY